MCVLVLLKILGKKAKTKPFSAIYSPSCRAVESFAPFYEKRYSHDSIITIKVSVVLVGVRLNRVKSNGKTSDFNT